MKLMLRGVEEESLAALLRRGAWVERLAAATSSGAIEELAASLRAKLGDLEPRAFRAVLEREAMASTGLGDEVAVPHAVVAGLSKPLLALGLAPQGIDFNAPDGQPAKLVFLLLMPARAHDQEVRLLAQIARAVIEPEARARLLGAKSLNETLTLVSEHRPRGDTMRPRRASLADI